MRRASALLLLASCCLTGRDRPAPSATPLGTLSLAATSPPSVGGLVFAGNGHPIELQGRLQRGNFGGDWTPVVTVEVGASGRSGPATYPMAAARELGPDVFAATLSVDGWPDGLRGLTATARGPGGASWTSQALVVAIDDTPADVELFLPSLATAPRALRWTGNAEALEILDCH